MLRMHLLPVWYNLSDEMVEDSIYDMRCAASWDSIFGRTGSGRDDAAEIPSYAGRYVRSCLEQSIMCWIRVEQ